MGSELKRGDILSSLFGGVEMAQYEGTFEMCGHEGVVCVTGPHKKREWYLEKKFGGYCPDCEDKMQQAKRNLDLQKALDESSKLELPNLIGSEKQVEWAQTLRSTLLKRFEAYDYEFICKKYASRINAEIQQIRYLFHDRYSDAENLQNLILSVLSEKTSARWFIDNRDIKLEWRDLILFITEINNMYPNVSDVIEIVEPAIEEATVYPERMETREVSEIKVLEDTVILKSFYNKKINEIVKDFGCKWSSHNKTWSMKVTERKGCAEDRAAELGNKLLASGFPIRIFDDEIRVKAVNATFEPVYPNWIYPSKQERYIKISWRDKNEAILARALLLPEAKESSYDNKTIFAKPIYFEEIEEFAQMFGFKITKEAQTILDDERATFENSPRISPKLSDEIKVNKNGLADILKSSDAILADLRDD